jgi:hypothetical protein
MASLARPVSLAFLVCALFTPLAARAAVLLVDYSVAPDTIYPADTSGALATSSAIDVAFSTRVAVSITLRDASGVTVRALYSSRGVTNPEPKLWDGTNDAGAPLPAGAYAVVIAATSTATSSETLFDDSRSIAIAESGPPPPPEFSPEPYALSLSSGWNLLSFPLAPEEPAAVDAFASPAVDAVWSYDPADPRAVGGWLVYDPAHPELSNLDAVAPGAGYFVRAHAAGVLAGEGEPLFAPGCAPPARSLAPGWNLVGAYATTSEDIDDAFASVGWAGIEYTALFGFMPGTSSFGLPSAIAPGAAFWIYTPAAATYAPSDL